MFLIRLSRGWSLYHRTGQDGEVVPYLSYRTKYARELKDVTKYKKLTAMWRSSIERWLNAHDQIPREKRPDQFHMRAYTAAKNALSVLQS